MSELDDAVHVVGVKALTSYEYRTYQSLIDRGFNREDALESALDGVDVRDLRLNRVRADG